MPGFSAFQVSVFHLHTSIKAFKKYQTGPQNLRLKKDAIMSKINSKNTKEIPSFASNSEMMRMPRKNGIICVKMA